MTDEFEMMENVKIGLLFRNFPGKNEEKREGPRNSRYPGQNSNREASKYGLESFLLRQLCLVRRFAGSHT